MTSEWVEDKVVFWGRPLETKWNGPSKSGFAEAYTNIEVIEEIKGKLPRKIKVYHDINGASCGVFFQLGTIQLIVLPESSTRNFHTSSDIEDAVSKIVVSAYVNDGVDFQLERIRGLMAAIYVDDILCETEKSDNSSESAYCDIETDYFLAQETYWSKMKHLESITDNKKWWQKLTWFKKR
jgi:hypothetical protein